MLVISEYFMLIQCLENLGEGSLHACISSFKYESYLTIFTLFGVLTTF